MQNCEYFYINFDNTFHILYSGAAGVRRIALKNMGKIIINLNIR